MSVLKHWLRGGWFPRRLLLHQQRCRPSDSNTIIDHCLFFLFLAIVLSVLLRFTASDYIQTVLYDKRDHFNFLIVNFPFICSNIPIAPAYGVFLSQLIRYSRACGSYQDFPDRELLPTRKLLTQGCLLVKLKSPLRKFYCWPLWNICVTNDHGYVPLVVNTSRSFPHSCRMM